MVVIFLYIRTRIYKRVPGVLMDFKVAERTKANTPHHQESITTILLYRATLKSQYMQAFYDRILYLTSTISMTSGFSNLRLSHTPAYLFFSPKYADDIVVLHSPEKVEFPIGDRGMVGGHSIVEHLHSKHLPRCLK